MVQKALAHNWAAEVECLKLHHKSHLPKVQILQQYTAEGETVYYCQRSPPQYLCALGVWIWDESISLKECMVWSLQLQIPEVSSWWKNCVVALCRAKFRIFKQAEMHFPAFIANLLQELRRCFLQSLYWLIVLLFTFTFLIMQPSVLLWL